MTAVRASQDFVTEERIHFAVKVADEIAARDHHLSGYDCAEAAVRKIFGPWLLDYAATVPSHHLPRYFRLVDEVEQRLGLHRCRRQGVVPHDPAFAGAPAPSANQAAAVA